MALDDLPLSGELVEDLRRLSAAYARVRDDNTALDSLERLEGEMYRAALEGRMRQLWQRAQTELGRRYAIGLLGPGMTRPAWGPAEGPEDNEIAF